jgi:hypothetical protein
VFLIIGYVVLRKTAYGRQVLATGGSVFGALLIGLIKAPRSLEHVVGLEAVQKRVMGSIGCTGACSNYPLCPIAISEVGVVFHLTKKASYVILFLVPPLNSVFCRFVPF